jgi:dienelactone hydrolase
VAIKTPWAGALAVVAAALGSGIQAAEPVPWDVAAFQKPPAASPAPLPDAVEGVQAVYLDGPPFQGKPTKFFAYYGLPKDVSGPVPGMVLVHGGAGTAYADWVKLWNKRGYAAIAFDHFGGLPEKVDGKWKRNPHGGPDHGGVWQMTWPVKDQWMYHAVADTMLAASFLASLPEVDPNRIGLTGISWGAVVASITSGVDSRYRFVAPVYGCGFLAWPGTDGSQFVGKNDPPERLAQWRALWDPSNYLDRAPMPFLWVNGTNDHAFTPRSWQLSQDRVPGPRTASLHARLEHSQSAGQAPEEIAAFADAILKDGKPLARITGQGRDGAAAWVEYESDVPLRSAALLVTRDEGKWQNRRWESLPAEIDAASRRIRATIPDDAVVYAFQLQDERGLVVSSDLRPEGAYAGNEK